jgi:ATP-dependent Lhr-like helicase
MVEHLGTLDPERIDEVVAEAQPAVRDADELHDLLLDLGGAPASFVAARGWTTLAKELGAAGRAARLIPMRGPAGDSVGAFWVAAERRSLAEAVWSGRTFVPDVVEPPPRRPRPWHDRDGALAEVMRGHLTLLGPTTARHLAAFLDLPRPDIEGALARVELEGNVLRGQFDQRLAATPAATDIELQWCDRRLLARINRRMLDGLRRAIEPATAADYFRFLLKWQHVAPGSRLEGRAGLLNVIGQLQGFESAAGAWEREILPARVNNYDPGWLDGLCLSGEIMWGRLAARDSAAAPSRVAPIALVRRRDLGWLLPTRDGLDDAQLSAPARDVLTVLRDAGASFLDDIVRDARRLRGEVEDALWELVGSGRVTGDGFAGLRALVSSTRGRGSTRARWHARWARRTGGNGVGGGGALGSGRWAVLRPPATTLDEDQTTEALARQYIRRYGVVLREVLAREPHAPTWRDLLRVYRRLEMRGEIRGGRLVAGFVGEQFAAPEALESLRAVRRDPEPEQVVRLSACDPLNLAGILTPGERIPATLNNTIHLRGGIPQIAVRTRTLADTADPIPLLRGTATASPLSS